MPKSTTTQLCLHFSYAPTAFTMRSAPPLRVIVMQRHSRLDSRLDEQRLDPEVSLAHLPQQSLQRRHHRGHQIPLTAFSSSPRMANNCRISTPYSSAVCCCKVEIRHCAASSGTAVPSSRKREDSDLGLRIANIKNQQHSEPSLYGYRTLGLSRSHVARRFRNGPLHLTSPRRFPAST